MFKKLQGKQTFLGVVGYCQKDSARCHYSIVRKNVLDLFLGKFNVLFKKKFQNILAINLSLRI